MIEAAAILSGLVRHSVDLAIILVLLVANAIVGFWEEYQAGNAIAALKAKLALKARARRDGRWTTLSACELVPADVVRLRLGEIVPADARLLEGDPVEVDQSALTGESLPVTRASGETVYSGSILRRGEIDAPVYGTGPNTYFGTTAQLVQVAHTVSHFQRAVLMLSVTMAVGARLLAQKEAIVSRLAAIEELAGMDVLSSDKTGTLTQNRLTLGEPFSVEGTSPDQLILSAALASRGEDQDTIDLALLSGLKNDQAMQAVQVVSTASPKRSVSCSS